MRKHKTWMLAAGMLAAAILPNWAQAASYTVTEASDDGTGMVNSLSWAINQANGNTEDDTITLQTDVTLSATLPQIISTMTIEGGGHFISGNNDSAVGRVLYITSDSNLTLNKTIIKGGNTTGDGGGIFNDGTVSTVTLTNSTVSGNKAPSGGGIFNNGTVMLMNSTVSGNIADSSSGGGIYNNGGTVILTNSTVSDNFAFSTSSSKSSGGGIFNSGFGTVTLTNSTVSGNISSSTTASAAGGGIFNYGTVTLTNSTVSGNISSAPSSSSEGGGFYNFGTGTVTLQSSIISGNTATSGNEVYNAGIVNAASFNVFGHGDKTNAEAFSGFAPGTSDVNATSDGGGTPTALNAILNTALADNGGPTQTHALVEGSPAVDLDKDCSTELTEDQRGEPRPLGNGCDAGAFESPYSTTTTFTVTPNAGAGGIVTPDTAQVVNEGDTATFIVTPDKGYTADAAVSGTCPKGSWDGSTYTTGQIAENCTVVFSFDKKANMAPIYKLLLLKRR